MKIVEILPELEVGGVERHVIDLSNELSRRGHKVLVISAGGAMLAQLSPDVRHRTMPVHKKNPLTALRCAGELSKLIRREGWQIVHAHSRVPAWITDFAACRSGVPFVVTAHVDFGTKSQWIYRPYRRAGRVICVSGAVCEGMKGCFYGNTEVILNGLTEPDVSWSRPEGEITRFLFVGRLSRVKGLQDVLTALPATGAWSLDVLGDGPMRDELERLAAAVRPASRIAFHGYAEYGVCDDYMSKSSCLLFPSYNEGMPLTLARAVQIGIPIVASDIAPVAEMCATPELLIPAGDAQRWRAAISGFLGGNYLLPRWKEVPTLRNQVDAVEKIYGELAGTA